MTTMNEHPMLTAWTVPPFDKIEVDDFKPALMRGMELYRANIAAIVADKAAPTFDNTIAALEDAGRPYKRAQTVFGVYTSTMNDKRDAEGRDRDVAGHGRVRRRDRPERGAVRAHQGTSTTRARRRSLRPSSCGSSRPSTRNFARRGAALGKADKDAAQADQRSAWRRCTPQFSQNELADEEAYSVDARRRRTISPACPRRERAAAKAAAEAKGLNGKWLITNTRSSMEPFLTYSTRRDLREKVWRMWVSRGEHAGAHDNRPVIAEILDAARRARAAARLPDATRTGSSTTTWRRRPTRRWR